MAVGVTRIVHGSLTSRATDQETYGLVGIMLAASMIASLLLPGGLSSGIAKFVAFHRGAGDVAGAWAAHRFLSRLGLASSVGLGVLSALVVGRLHQLDPLDATSLALLTATYSLYTLDKAAMYGHSLVPQYARIELGTSLLAIVTTVVVIVTGESAYLLPLCLGYGSFAVLCRRQLRRHRRSEGVTEQGSFDRRQVLTFAVLGSIGTLASAGFLQATQLLAGQFAAPAEVAFLAAAVALIAPLYFLPRAMALALFPAMASAHGSGDRSAVRKQVDASTRGLAVTMTPVFLVGLLAAPLILSLYGGSEYADGAGVLRIMLCASYFGILQVPSVNALASGAPAQARIPVVSAVVGCLVGLSVVIATAGSMGAMGVAIGYLVGTTITALIPIVAIWRIHQLTWAGVLTRCVTLITIGTLVTQLDLLLNWSWSTAVVAGTVLVVALAVLSGDLRRLLWLLRQGRTSRAGQDPGPRPESPALQGETP
ncbi:lipopolysaccharide biosynthesis protein [Micromonospora sonneratiae]|uniref:Lipopolysaccharide biosynthesis protein n=1 Tax=Micromonospora sonneratiae TaxID=1184706 RepID=A0ABW3Y956_9ACTN